MNILLLSALLIMHLSRAQVEPEKPNIIFIMSDDHAAEAIGAYGSRLADLDLDGHLPGEKQYLAREMKELGYSTAIIGKYHLHDEPSLFDYYKVLPGQGTYFNPDFHEKGKGVWPDNRVKSEGHSSDVITDLSIEYLENRDKSKPFFLMHHYKAPHDMFEFAPRYAGFLEAFNG